MRPSIRRFSLFSTVLIAASSTVFATSCLDLKVETDPSGAGGTGSSSSGDATSSSGGAPTSSSSSASGSSGSSSSSVSSSSSSGMGEVCGDAVLEGSEQCDDGNAVSGDGCSATCQLESAAGCPGMAIPISKGQKVDVMGSTAGAPDTFIGAATGGIGNCINGSWVGADVIYRVEPKENGNLTVTADIGYSNSYLHVRSQCPGTPTEQLACEYRPTPGILSWTLPVSQDAVYYVAVDTFNSSSGPFTVTFALQ